MNKFIISLINVCVKFDKRQIHLRYHYINFSGYLVCKIDMRLKSIHMNGQRAYLVHIYTYTE